MKNRAFKKLKMLLANKKAMAPVIFYLLILTLIVVVIGGILYIASSIQQPELRIGPRPGEPPPTEVRCELASTPVARFNCNDKYGGSITSGLLSYRKEGAVSWTDSSCGSNATVIYGTKLHIHAGLNDADDDAEATQVATDKDGNAVKLQYWDAYQKKLVDCAGDYCIIPCQEEVDIYIPMADDDAATNLVVAIFDPSDNNKISSSDTVDIDTSDITMKGYWYSTSKTDFGSEYCWVKNGIGSVLVYRTNTTCTDDIELRYEDPDTGKTMTAVEYGGNINRLLAASSGYTDYTFKLPNLENADYLNFWVDFDADGTTGCDGGSSNHTVYLYDSHQFANNDETPVEIQCDIMDEDGNEVGATAADSFTVYITDD